MTADIKPVALPTPFGYVEPRQDLSGYEVFDEPGPRRAPIWNTLGMEQAIDALRAEVGRLRNKLQAMHRRAQTAEAAHVEYKKLMAIPPDGDGVRFVNGSLGRVLLGSYCYKLREEAERAEALAAELAKSLAEMLELRAASLDCRLTERHELDVVRDARAALSRAANDTQAGGGGA